MVRHLRIHRADDRDVVRVRRRLRKDLADLEATLAVFLELKRRRKRRSGLALGAEILAWQRLTRVLRQQRLGIERVHVRRTAVQEEMDDAFCFGCKVRRPRNRRRCQHRLALRQGAQREGAHTHAGACEKIATVQAGTGERAHGWKASVRRHG